MINCLFFSLSFLSFYSGESKINSYVLFKCFLNFIRVNYSYSVFVNLENVERMLKAMEKIFEYLVLIFLLSYSFHSEHFFSFISIAFKTPNPFKGSKTPLPFRGLNSPTWTTRVFNQAMDSNSPLAKPLRLLLPSDWMVISFIHPLFATIKNLYMHFIIAFGNCKNK